ncbi:MAG: tRNA pseudouridine(38-40) synthase TruA [Myxococcota bacterium]|nr:tRNA pseudouridine(38-40) synthase TruA [Myxococcota bacterium]
MPRLKLTLEYDGTDFVGWQFQLNGRSVQEVLERALEELLGARHRIQGASRTDSGVHALGQVASFVTERRLPLLAYERGLNGLLPPDLSVVRAEEVREDFDPRLWSLGKRYRYRIINRPGRAPMSRRTHWQVFPPLDVDAMRVASTALIGKHDFSAFRAADCQAAHALREIRSLRVSGHAGEELVVEVNGTAFLKHMVRNLVGTLVHVGKRKAPPEWVGEVLESRDRKRAGPTAPPQGLELVEVLYGEGPPAHLSPETGDDE